MARLTGQDAIRYAEAHESVRLCKYTDPTEEAREGLTVEEAREVAREDPELIWCSVQPERCSVCGGALPALDDDLDRLAEHLVDPDTGDCPGSLCVDATGQVLGCGAWTSEAWARNDLDEHDRDAEPA